VNFTMYSLNFSGRLRHGVLACLLLLAGNIAIAQEEVEPQAPVGTGLPEVDAFIAQHPTGSIQSEENANQALLEAARQRTALDNRYTEETHACYSKFFATPCLDNAKKTRRLAVNQIRKIEIESNSFLRSYRAAERDKNLAEKRAKAADNPPKPMHELAPKKPQPEHKSDERDRIAEHDAKLEHEQQEERNDAAKRAENVAAFNKKAQDALDRQRDVANKKAEKAKQAAAKAAAASSAAASASASASSSPMPPPKP
jgi:colicin import membrane protein